MSFIVLRCNDGSLGIQVTHVLGPFMDEATAESHIKTDGYFYYESSIYFVVPATVVKFYGKICPKCKGHKQYVAGPIDPMNDIRGTTVPCDQCQGKGHL
jgi:hypothetical protein